MQGRGGGEPADPGAGPDPGPAELRAAVSGYLAGVLPATGPGHDRNGTDPHTAAQSG
ncbi:hypothetical protein [Actinomadura livida]|uniref:Uncharacterized protein n=1 Tax=Actinomadura livida TaxID=79909 RepID=A0A7W7IE54_9ACTN|nr:MULTISPECIES: hypothetical protein [Actinomadura]MBB4775366.1 hypothetical protein [Actinomadura catellatispora]GGT89857.1 hypothetical protein GCM10010208_10800 [Actinomadura livida]